MVYGGSKLAAAGSARAAFPNIRLEHRQRQAKGSARKLVRPKEWRNGRSGRPKNMNTLYPLLHLPCLAPFFARKRIIKPPLVNHNCVVFPSVLRYRPELASCVLMRPPDERART